MMPLNTITQAAASACHRSSVKLPPLRMLPLPGRLEAPPHADVLDQMRVGEEANQQPAA